MNRKIQIDRLLRLVKEKIQNDPKFNIDSEDGYTFVYNNTVFGTVKEQEKSILIDRHGSSKNNYGSIFDNWIKYFKDDQNLEVFCPEGEYYCQFEYRHLNVEKSPTHLKMYIPLDQNNYLNF